MGETNLSAPVNKKFHQLVITVRQITLLLVALPLSVNIDTAAVSAQSITPANDGTGTLITIDGNTIEINGGTLSGDGNNLFHSFEQFGLDSNQIAELISSPQISNILGRVVGGEPSVINGLIQVVGGNSNLFLMNPAGFIFGADAQLNVTGDFTATTATGIGFSNGNWFNAFSSNDYQNLVGEPTVFAFDQVQPGSIINAGNLAVAAGKNLTLLAGNVINTGTLTTSSGNVTVAAVPGESLVRISQPGSLLSLEIEPPRDIQGQVLPITALDLPSLLTGTENVETGLTVSATGEVRLTNSGVTVPNLPGTTIVSGIINVANLGVQSIALGGNVNVLGEYVGVVGGSINASGTDGGGLVQIGGGYQGEGNVPNALRTLVNNEAIISTDALTNGDGGQVIVWADEVTAFEGNISARGGSNSGDGGLVEVSGKENLIFDGVVDVGAVNGELGTVLLDPANITISDAVSTDGVEAGLPAIFQDEFADADLVINTDTLAAQTGNVVLEATGDITLAADTSLVFEASEASIEFTADADVDSDGSFVMEGGSQLVTNERLLTITAADIVLDETALINAGAGDVTFQPSNPNLSIGIGDGAAGEFNLSTVELTASLDSSGTLTIGSPGFTGTGDVTIQNMDLVNSGIDLDNYNLTVRGGDIFFIGPNNNNLSNPIVQPAAGRTVQFISSGTIFEGDNATDIEIDGSSGQVLLDAAEGIVGTSDPQLEDEFGGFDISAGIVAARVRNSGDIEIQFQNVNSTISSVGGVEGISTADGSISLGYRGGDPNVTIIRVTVNQPIVAGESGSISIAGFTGDTTNQINLNSSITSDSGEIIFDAPVTLGTDVEITSSSGNIVFNSTVDGNQILNINSDSGNIQFNEALGSTNSLSGLEITTNSTFRLDTPATVAGDISIVATQIELSNLLDAGDGAINVNANENITVTNTISAAQINLISTNGEIDTTGGTLNSTEEGIINLTTLRNINLGNINSGSLAINTESNFTIENPISLEGLEIQAENIETLAAVEVGSQGINLNADGTVNFNGTVTVNNGGAVNVNANENITTRDIIAPGGISLISEQGTITTADLNTSGNGGGNIFLNSPIAITAGSINTSGSQGNGGDVTLDPEGDIQIAFINAQGGENGRGGRVEIETESFFRATDTFTDRNGVLASISTAGGDDGGSITIFHGGGFFIFPFVVGNGENNGTAGALTTSIDNTIAPVETLRLPISQGDINVVTESVLISEPEVIPPESKKQPTIEPLQEEETATEVADEPESSEEELELPSPPVAFTPSENMLPDEVIVERFEETYTNQINDYLTSAVISSEINIAPTTATELPETDTTPLTTTESSPTNFNYQSVTEQSLRETNQSQASSIQENETVSNNQTWEDESVKEPEVEDGETEPEVEEKETGDDEKQEIEEIYIKTLAEIRTELLQIEQFTQGAVKPAIIYVSFPAKRNILQVDPELTPYLQLILVTGTPGQENLTKLVPSATRSQIKNIARLFRRELDSGNKVNREKYKHYSQQLYQWLIKPLEAEFQKQGINNLVFVMDADLRSIPLAALHDGNNFLIEKYSVGLMPSMSLTDTRYRDISREPALAMGASQFPVSQLPPLYAVMSELDYIKNAQGGEAFPNDNFTINNLQQQVTQQNFAILHIATHAKFERGNPNNSYIQFWEEGLTLGQIPQLQLDKTRIELLVLSACETARGDRQAELGFAGMAYQAGVKSVMASLWQVNDLATLGLMTQFYQQLKTQPIKAEALRQAQLAMLRGEVVINDGKLFAPGLPEQGLPLPQQLSEVNNRNISHPYYWSGFTIVGNPW